MNFFSKIDERNILIALKVIAVMYFITIFSMHGIIIYRQFVLGQEIERFEGLAVLATFNSLFLISALLYYGALSIKKFNIKAILFGYLFIVILGSVFTYVKYNVVQDVGLSLEQLFDKLVIVFSISGLFFIISMSIKKKAEKD